MARFVYRPKHPKASEHGFVALEDLGDDIWTQEQKTVPVVTDRYMEGVRATDGVDIGSRQKRREYMRVTGLADADDFSDAFRAKVRKEREQQDTQERREALGRAAYELKEKHGRRN